MNKRSLGALIVLNLMLLAAVVVVNLTPAPAAAQGLGGGRGNYIMIAGSVPGRSNQSAVYVVELNSARMMVVFFNASTNSFEFVAGRDVYNDARNVSGGGGGR
jgi:hypothetical protein